MFGKNSVVLSCVGVLVVAGVAFAEPPQAEVSYLGSSVEFTPRTWDQGFLLTVSAPDGSIVQKTVKEGVLSFDLSELEGAVIDGHYEYELVQIVSLPRQRDVAPDKAGPEPQIKASSLSGSFLVAGGSIVPRGGDEPAAPSGGPDAPDYYYVDEEFCAGWDCGASEVFAATETLKLKQNNTGIRFEDTSTSGGFPTNDWRIWANDTYSGGTSYLGFYDVDGAARPVTIEAGAASNVLVVDSAERVGINTNTPANELHVRAASSPVITMEQSGGTPYRWDMYADDSYWYVRDFTSNTYPLILEDNSPTYGLVLKSDGKVGNGVFTPTYQFEVYRSGVNSNVVVTRSGGAQNYINATASFGNFGTVSNHPLRLVVNSVWQMRINSDSSISMANSASLTAGGVWTDASSRALKQDIEGLSVEEATAALTGLEPVKFAYKSNGERHVGFIAEDVPELVASADRNGLSPMDVVAVLTRVVQQQQIVYQKQKKTLESQQQRLQEQQMLTESLQTTINQLMSRISALESR